jgi:4-amino-4-deoxy-L-arabinose transferase-like glycosyltransferase
MDDFPGQRWSRPKLFVALATLVVVSYPLFFYRLGERDLSSSHEGRAAQDAQSILDDGCWGLPHLFDLRPELQKPPFYYWLVAAVGWIKGVDEWSVRLPAALSGLATMVALLLWCQARSRPVTGFAAALMLGTAAHYTWLARTGRIDMPLAAAVTVALLAFLRALAGDGRAWALLGYFATAVAVMFKGPVGLVLVAAVLGAVMAVERVLFQRSLWRHLGLPWGVPLLVLLVAPWFIWASAKTNGAFLQTFFLHHNFERAFGGGTLRAHPWWFYLPRFATDFLPWSALFAIACWYFARDASWRQDAQMRFGFCWLAAIGLVLSVFRFKRADYLLPAYPGAALVLGCAFERWSAGHRRWAAFSFGATLSILVTAWIVVIHSVLPRYEPMYEHRRFAQAIRRHAPAPQLVLFFRAESHSLAFHVGAPIDTFLEWENLNTWVGRPGAYYIVMPPECFEESRRHLTAGHLELVLRNTDFPDAAQHERPLVLVRTCPQQRVTNDPTRFGADSCRCSSRHSLPASDAPPDSGRTASHRSGDQSAPLWPGLSSRFAADPRGMDGNAPAAEPGIRDPVHR